MSTVRPSEPGDTDALKRLMIELQIAERKIDPARAAPTEAFAEWYLAPLQEAIIENDGVLLVAVEGDTVCGFIAAYAEEEMENQTRDFYISEVVVSEAYRQRGIGSALLRAVEDVARAKGFKRLHIGVLAGSSDVLRLYRNLGFADYLINLKKEL